MNPKTGPLLYRRLVLRTPERERKCEVAHDGQGFRIRREGTESVLLWEDLGNGRALLELDGHACEARVTTSPDGVVEIERAGHRFTIRVENELAALVRTTQGHHGETFSLRAPMPGTIVSLMVEPGQTVALEQPLLVLEAMKMQNELAAPIAGVVEDLGIKPGQAVQADQVLLRIRP
jgi:biotin carboxyl carrier protein